MTSPSARPTPGQLPLAVPATIVVVDTDAFSKVFVRPTGTGAAQVEVAALKLRLQGKIAVIATQTLAELQAWPLLRGWGTARSAKLTQLLNGTTTVPVTRDVVDAFVALTVQCKATGHALAANQHVADRWVAATAVALDRPLLALDQIYVGAPGLPLLP